MPDPTRGGVKTQGPRVPQAEEEYYSEDEEDYDDEDDDEIEDDDDDIVVGRDDENKENKLGQTIGEKRTKGRTALKQEFEDGVEDVGSANASEDKRSIGSQQQQHVLQQHQQQQQQQQQKPAKSGGLCSGKSSTQVKDTHKPANVQQKADSEAVSGEDGSSKEKPRAKKSGGLCSGKSSTEIKDTQRPADAKEKTDSETVPSEGAQAKENAKPSVKKSGGLCRGNKNVEVEDSLRPADPGTTHPPSTPEDPKEIKKPGQDTTTQGTEVRDSGKSKEGTKKSGGLCGGKKSVQVEEPMAPGKKSQETGKPEKKQQPETEIQQNRGVPEQSPAKKSGGLCGGKSSVEVKDSLLPAAVDKPVVEETAIQMKASNLKGNQNFQGEEDEDEESEISEGKFTKKKKKPKAKNVATEEERSYNTFDDDEDMTEIYVGPEPPPPTLKKVKKKKKGEGSYVKEDPLSMRRGKYAVIMAEDETLPARRKSKGKSESPSKEIQDSQLEDGERGQSPQKKKKKKKLPLETDPELDVRSVYESQLAEVEALPLHEDTIEFTTDSLQPTFEDENELLENAKQERQKNKQRLREKKMREKEFDSPVKESDGVTRAYSSAQREIERVLQPGDSTEKEDGKKSKDKKKKSKEGKENEAYEETEGKETLSEARDRMHKLLDDAFTLISQSHSSIGSKSEKTKKDSDDSDDEKKKKAKKSKKSKPETPPSRDEEEPATEEKKHTPLYVQRSHGAYDSSGLITWSPYSAGDEVNTIISLPSAQSNQPPYVPRQEKTSTSVFSERVPDNIKPYYTNEPAEPIVINTRNMDTNMPPNQDGSHAHGMGAFRGTFQNPVHFSPMPYTTMDRYSEPYHGMSSFQEIPQRDTDPVAAGVDRRLAATDPSAGSGVNRGDGNVIMVQEHRPPQSRDRPNQDVADVIYDSMRPGTSPQPLIDSLRGELQGLSHRRATEGDGRHGSTLIETSSGANGKTNGTTKRHSLLGSREGTPPDL